MIGDHLRPHCTTEEQRQHLVDMASRAKAIDAERTDIAQAVDDLRGAGLHNANPVVHGSRGGRNTLLRALGQSREG